MYWGKYGYYGDLCSFMEESRGEEKLQQSIQGWKMIKKNMAQKNLEATMVVVTAIKILVSSHQDIGKAALANL